MPLNYEDDPNIEDEGMLGKVLNDGRKNQKELNEKIDAIEKKVEKKIDEN